MKKFTRTHTHKLTYNLYEMYTSEERKKPSQVLPMKWYQLCLISSLFLLILKNNNICDDKCCANIVENRAHKNQRLLQVKLNGHTQTNLSVKVSIFRTQFCVNSVEIQWAWQNSFEKRFVRKIPSFLLLYFTQNSIKPFEHNYY